MDFQKINKVAIYPAIGIARVGNSREFFFASEVPGKSPSPSGGFKDGDNLFKKQVPLFRVYALDEADTPLIELTAEMAQIEWRVHLANRKAAWYQFNNAMDLGDKSIPSTKRNGALNGPYRQQLIIDPGSRSISGGSVSGNAYQLNGNFLGKEVSLGEIRTDEKGRLMVFGGNGVSASALNQPAITFANNDGWHDDVSDGTVRATVTINGATFEAKPSVVICTPPNFAPGLFPVVSMHDVVHDLFLREKWEKPAGKTNFFKDVYPMLHNLSSAQWVNEGFFMLFGTNSPSDFNDSQYIQVLSDPSETSSSERSRVFAWFRDTLSVNYDPDKLPPHYGDLFGDYEALPHVDLSITATQYEHLRNWAGGNFITGALEMEIDFEDMNAEQQTSALLRAPLAECLGGPFHPGIEITWPFRRISMWEEPYRLKLLPEMEEVIDDYGPILTSQVTLGPGGAVDGSGPGTLTRWLGVPWQTDEASCLAGYDTTLYLPLPSFWSVRVPNTVLSSDSFQRTIIPGLNQGQQLKHFSYRVDWMRDFNTAYVPRINSMVRSWHDLAVITKNDVKTASPFLPDVWWVETDRNGPAGEDPTLKQVKLAEKEIIAEDHELVNGALAFTVRLKDEGMIRESKPLKRHEL